MPEKSCREKQIHRLAPDDTRRVARRSAWLATLSFALCVAMACLSNFSSSAQNAPLDASESSRDLLYLAPSRTETRTAGDVVTTAYVGARFEYSQPDGGKWLIRPASTKIVESKEKQRVFSLDAFGAGPGGYELVGASGDDRATLALRNKGTSEALTTVTLWDRDQLVEAWLPEMRKQKRGTTADGLRQDLEVADPEVRAMTRLPGADSSVVDQPILVAVGQSTGEDELGLATIVKFDPSLKKATVYHPAGSLTCEVSTIGVSSNPQKISSAVWFGTRTVREGTMAPCGGLAKLDLETRAVAPVSGAKNPPIGSIVTLLASAGQGSMIAATDAGICKLARNNETDWECWRLVPTVKLSQTTAIANRPGDKPYGQLKAGDYEVLWANQNYLEVVTPDSYDAWLAADDFAEAAARNFDAEPYKLLNTASGGAAPIRPLAKPKGEPLEGALEYRAALEKLPTPPGTPDGWVHVRTRVGWITRQSLDVVPRLVSAQK
jgi:hypothetical protein